MNFHPEDFLALSLMVEKEGGALLDELCEGKQFPLKVPAADGKLHWRTFHTTHCSKHSLMEIPYDETLHIRIADDDDLTLVVVDHPGEDAQYSVPTSAYGPDGEKKRITRKVKVCAVDDAVGLWPRYAGVVSDRSYQS